MIPAVKVAVPIVPVIWPAADIFTHVDAVWGTGVPWTLALLEKEATAVAPTRDVVDDPAEVPRDIVPEPLEVQAVVELILTL